MTRPELKVIPSAGEPPALSIAEQIRRLQADARSLAGEHVAALTRAMVDLAELASEIADGGEVYSPGVREVARQLAEDLDTRAQTISAIANRSAR